MPPGLAAPFAGLALTVPLFYMAAVMLADPGGFLSLVQALARAASALSGERRPLLPDSFTNPGARAFVRLYGAVLALLGLAAAGRLGLR